MRVRPAHLLLSGVLLLAPLSACGSSSNKDSTSNSSSTTASASGTTKATGGSSSNDAVTKYCDDVHTYANQLASDIEKKDYTAAQQLAQSVDQKLQDEGKAAAAEAQNDPQGSYLKCQQDAQAAAQRLAAAAASSYGGYNP